VAPSVVEAWAAPALQVEFRSNVIVTMDISSDEGLSEEAIKQIGQLFQESYNSVSVETCDSLYRPVSSVTHDQGATVPTRDRRSLQRYTVVLFYVVAGQCRDCSVDADLFDEGVVALGSFVDVLQAFLDSQFAGFSVTEVQELNSLAY
jgi:hypothetical protein